MEEAIDTLTGSYKSSGYYLEVTRQVAEIRKEEVECSLEKLDILSLAITYF